MVTVLFADLRGSTAIGELLDPEAVRRVLIRFYDAAREVIERHGGTVEKEHVSHGEKSSSALLAGGRDACL